MKTIILKSLTFRNWKGISFRKTEFNKETVISGDNETGKTRHFDAYLWLLFGVDSQGRLNYGIRTLENGILSFDGECSVEGVFTMNQREITLTERTYYPEYVIREIIEKAVDEIEKTVTRREKFTYKGFGTFKVKHKKARYGRDIGRNKMIEIPEHNEPSFLPGKEFKQKVNGEI